MQKMREADELDSPATLATPRGWVAVMVILVVTVAAVIWTFAGSLPIEVSAPGLLTTRGGTASVQTAWTGTVTKVPTRLDAQLPAGAAVAVLEAPDGTQHTVLTHVAGKVVGIAVAVGQVLASGATVATVERTDDPDGQMIAMLFVPDSKAAGLRPGASADLLVATAPSSKYGLLRGHIDEVSPYRVTPGQVAGLVGGADAAAAFTGSGAPRLVTVTLDRDDATASGLAWSTKKGPPFRLGTQVAVSGTITVSSQTPFALLFGR